MAPAAASFLPPATPESHGQHGAALRSEPRCRRPYPRCPSCSLRPSRHAKAHGLPRALCGTRLGSAPAPAAISPRAFLPPFPPILPSIPVLMVSSYLLVPTPFSASYPRPGNPVPFLPLCGLHRALAAGDSFVGVGGDPAPPGPLFYTTAAAPCPWPRVDGGAGCSCRAGSCAPSASWHWHGELQCSEGSSGQPELGQPRAWAEYERPMASCFPPFHGW